jgi:hypothetical protein
LLPFAAAYRLTQRLLALPGRAASDFLVTPSVLDGLLEQPLRAEAALIKKGARLPVGLSLLGVFTPTDSQECETRVDVGSSSNVSRDHRAMERPPPGIRPSRQPPFHTGPRQTVSERSQWPRPSICFRGSQVDPQSPSPSSVGPHAAPRLLVRPRVGVHPKEDLEAIEDEMCHCAEKESSEGGSRNLSIHLRGPTAPTLLRVPPGKSAAILSDSITEQTHERENRT